MQFGEQFEMFGRGEEPSFHPDTDMEVQRPAPIKRESLERVDCQYCQDVGVCPYCKRGKEETAKLMKKPPKPLF